jgi:hypothetical protein
MSLPGSIPFKTIRMFSDEDQLGRLFLTCSFGHSLAEGRPLILTYRVCHCRRNITIVWSSGLVEITNLRDD